MPKKRPSLRKDENETAYAHPICNNPTEVPMDRLDAVSLMAAVIYATHTTGIDITPKDQEKFYHNAAQQAWGLYHAVRASPGYSEGK